MRTVFTTTYGIQRHDANGFTYFNIIAAEMMASAVSTSTEPSTGGQVVSSTSIGRLADYPYNPATRT